MGRGLLTAGLAALVLALPGLALGAPAGSTLLVSRPSGLGAVPPAFDNNSQTPGALSSGGRYAVFTSQADGFATGADPAVQNVLLRDRQTNTTVLVSRSDGSNGIGANRDSSAPAVALAPAGVMPTPPTNQPHVLVTFVSQASNLVDHVSGHTLPPGPDQVWMRDVTAGTTTLISRADGAAGDPANSAGVDSDWPGAIAMAPGGPVVAFSASSSNLPGGAGGMFLRTVNSSKTEVVSCKNRDCSGTPTAVAASHPSITTNGTNVDIAVDSSDKTITGDATGHTQVVLAVGSAPQHANEGAGEPGLFLLASVASSNSGTLGNGNSGSPSISPDGEQIAFVSGATNLTSDTVPASTEEAFVHDFTGPSTTLISRATGASGAAANQGASSVGLGGDPSHLRAVFDSSATNLGVANANTQSYVRDLSEQVTSALNRRSGTAGVLGTEFSSDPVISANGSVALFTTRSGNLGDGSGDRFQRVHARTLPSADVRAGAVSLVSRPGGVAPFQGRTDDSFIGQANAVSANGRYVVFASQSTSLFGGSDPHQAYVYVRDLLTNRTTLVSRATGVNGAIANATDSDVDIGGISADGRFVAFDSTATNLSPAATNGQSQVYVRDLVKNTTTLVSRAAGPTGAPAADGAYAQGFSADGKAVLIETTSALDPAGAAGTFHLYRRNLTTNTTTLVDRDNGAAGAVSAQSYNRAAIDADGNRVVFSTKAPLAGSPADGVERVFVRDIKAGTTTLASRADGATGAPASSDSDEVAIDAGGDEVAFTSYAQNLGAPSFFNHQIFIRRLTTSQTLHGSVVSGAVTGSDAESPSFDATGDRLAFTEAGTTTIPSTAEAYVRDLSAQDGVLVSRANGVFGAPANGDIQDVALDPTGDCLAFQTASSNLGDGFGSLDFDSVHLRVLRGRCPLALPPPPKPVLTKLRVKKSTVSFTLNVAAKVTLKFLQLKPGRRHGKKCVLHRKHGKKCTVAKQRRKLSVAGTAGANKVKFKRSKLPAGRYRLTATPAGGKTKSVSFTVRH